MDYPAKLEVDTPAKLANWRPLVQWILAIPHLIISNVLNTVAEVCALISWFAILFTGRMPEGLAGMIRMSARYQSRAVAFAGFLHDQYPPFEFSSANADPGGTPVRVDFQPAPQERNRLTCALRILWLIPAALFTILIMLVGVICWFIAFFAVLFTGKWPAALHGWVMKGMRAGLRLNAYAFLLTDTYPPFATG
ncbi:MAG: DUF4389 domain-containing protein [Actinobacteria bacterium]|nr:DUF4389 domain-containing protein [Actinomycetota bacterium]